MAQEFSMSTDRPASGGSPKRGLARKHAIEAVATRLLLEKGYSATSMLDVAKEAKASKETLYRHFPSKEALFQAIVSNIACDMERSLTGTEGDFGATLDSFAQQLLKVATSQQAIQLYRLIIAEGGKFPELGRIFHRAGPERIRALVAQAIEAARQRGELTCDDPIEAAATFHNLLVGDYLQRGLLGLDRDLTDRALAERRKRALRLFRACYRP